MSGEIYVNVNFVIGIMSAAPIKRTRDDRINKKAIDLHVELSAIELIDLCGWCSKEVIWRRYGVYALYATPKFLCAV